MHRQETTLYIQPQRLEVCLITQELTREHNTHPYGVLTTHLKLHKRLSVSNASVQNRSTLSLRTHPAADDFEAQIARLLRNAMLLFLY